MIEKELIEKLKLKIEDDRWRAKEYRERNNDYLEGFYNGCEKRALEIKRWLEEKERIIK